MEEEIINKYHLEFLKYKRRVFPELLKQIKYGQHTINKYLSSLINFYLHQLYFLDYQNIYFTQPPRNSLNTLYTKTACDIYGLYQCVSVGQVVPASYIQRSIFETFVTVKLITEKDLELRSKLFEDYIHVLRYNRYKEYSNYLSKLESKLPDSKELYDNIESRLKEAFPDSESLNIIYDSVKLNYNINYPYHWAYSIYKDKLGKKKKITLKFICEELGLIEDYFDIYSTSSLALHNEPLIINLMQTQGFSTPSPIFSEKLQYMCGISLNLAIELVLDLFKAINSPKYEELKIYLHNYYKKYYSDLKE